MWSANAPRAIPWLLIGGEVVRAHLVFELVVLFYTLYMLYTVYFIFVFFFFIFLGSPFLTMRTLCDLDVGEEKPCFKFLKKNWENFFEKPKKFFYFYVSLGSSTVFIDFDPLWHNIHLYMSNEYMLDLSPKCVISYPNSNPNISFWFWV